MRIKLAVLIGAALLLTGCAADPDAAFIAQVETDAPKVLERGTEEQAIKLAQIMCESMDDGASGYDQADTMQSAGFDIADSGKFVIAVVDNYCPEHAQEVR